MIIRQNELDFLAYPAITKELFTEGALFFDIETTGFSPKQTTLYLIGCACRKGDTLILRQFFAEHPEQEAEILSAFLNELNSYDTIITFNGIGFDIPYLKAKCSQYDLKERFSDFAYLDIFKSVSGMKQFLKLENYKQKSVEQFLKIPRNDLYSGGELIQFYHAYAKNPKEELADLLLLHNYEDVTGMTNLLPILSYDRLFHGIFEEILQFEVQEYRAYDGSMQKELQIVLRSVYELPQRISHRAFDIYLTAENGCVQMTVPVTAEPLKYFYPNYKDYYYLPEEDTAIHKSVAAYVDKEHRMQAKAATCYTKRAAWFLPQFHSNFQTPAFYRNYGDKLSYFEYSRELFENSKMQECYVRHLLAAMSNSKLKL